MPTALSKFFNADSESEQTGAQWLQLVLGDWQVIADLMGADLVLWIRRDIGGKDTMVAVGHTRPGNGTTVYYDDPVGNRYAPADWPQMADAFESPTVSTQEWTVERDERTASVMFAPVCTGGEIIALLSVESFTSFQTGHLGTTEAEMRRLGMRLLVMLSEGSFPILGAPVPPRRGAPRVQDGLVSLDASGRVLWCSPNALSAFHRFGIDGDLTGESLAEHATDMLRSRATVDESLPLVLMGRAAWRADMQGRGSTLSLRAVPLKQGDTRIGAILLVRDVTELRRRERELMTRDATIREVHHRVKNNLQTVAALLRLQSRRMKSEEAKEALLEAMRRVSTIALVHESLLQGSEETVFFDDIIDRCLRLAVDAAAATVSAPSADGGAHGPATVRTERRGKVGVIRAEEATPLALVVTELAMNAVEHGLARSGGTLEVVAERTGSHLKIHVDDDGPGMAGKPDGLGTTIAQNLVEGELGGVLSWQNRPDAGTRATIEVYLDPVIV